MEESDSTDPHDGDEEFTVEASFALLELSLEKLAETAPVQSAEQLLQLMPSASNEGRRLILTELIKFDLAAARENGQPRTLEFYWPTVANILPQENIPFDLVLEEVQLRKAAGDHPKWADYRQRFPDLADTIGKWLAGGETEAAAATSTSSVPELPVGEVFDDFEVQKQLGQGAFARVYLAKQRSMQRLVALKATTRGSEEPQALSRLDHANIVRVYDQREVSEPPTILLYMQYLAGGTLADSIKHARSIPRELWNGSLMLESIDLNLLEASQTVPEQSAIRNHISKMSWAECVAWIGIQLAEGLSYADQKGVLHRDVKPANILLSAEAIPKLADFNVSCSGLSGRAGAAAYFGGSLAYMSPEQLQVADPTDPLEADKLDGRSDLYALGIVLWELWQGKRPWTLTGLASNWTEAVVMQREIRQKVFAPPVPATTSAERVLENVLRGLLEVDPEKRPASGKEAAARLRLAFYPELANRFAPSPKSFSGRLLSIPVLLLSLLIIFGPNTAASRFNYTYNHYRFEHEYQEIESDLQSSANLNTAESPENLEGFPGDDGPNSLNTSNEVNGKEERSIFEFFKRLSGWINTIVYPLGGILFLLIILPLARIMERARQGKVAKQREIAYLWSIGTRATVICMILWSVSGCIFPWAMHMYFPEIFGASDAFHFFMSLVLCGGVAWIYPYFGMTLLSLMIYYPRVINPAMEDAEFDRRCARVRKFNSWYLASAAVIPLAAIGLVVQRTIMHKGYINLGVIITLIGLGFAYYAHLKIDQTLSQYAKVLGKKDDQMIV